MSEHEFSITGTTVDFNADTKDFKIVLTDTVMTEKEIQTMIEFGEELGASQHQVTLTVKMNINAVLDEIMDSNGIECYDDVEESGVRDNLEALRAELQVALNRLNEVLGTQTFS